MDDQETEEKLLEEQNRKVKEKERLDARYLELKYTKERKKQLFGDMDKVKEELARFMKENEERIVSSN